MFTLDKSRPILAISLPIVELIQLAIMSMDTLRTNLIYVIDDDNDDFQILLDVLIGRWPKLHVRHFEKPDAFVSSLYRLEKPGIIVLDINMPKLSGFDVIRCLKSDESWKEVPVVFLSTSGDSKSKAKAIEMGACAYLTKPTTASEFSSVAQVIRNCQVLQGI